MEHAESTKIHAATIDEVVTTVIMARVTDYFGFFVYAIASALVFPRLFFPNFDPVAGTLLSFAVFPLAFLARPLGSVLGKYVQASFGQTGRVAIAMMILGISTVAIGLLPSFHAVGWLAPVLLAGLRIAQGIGLGSAWDGITVQLLNAAPKGRQGLYGMVPQLGGPIGFCVAASLFFVLTGFLTDEEFISFGWRFAFFGVMAVNVVSLFARLRLLTADFGPDKLPPEHVPLMPLLRRQWRPILISAFMPLASYALFHMVTVFPLAHALLYSSDHVSYILILQLVGGMLCVFTTVASGYLSDIFGRHRILALCTLLIPVLCLATWTLDGNPWMYIIFGFMLLGLAFGQSSAIAPARFEPDCRFSGTVVSTNLSWIVGAAFAPLVGLALTVEFGLGASAIYLLSGAVVTACVLYVRYGVEAFSIGRLPTPE